MPPNSLPPNLSSIRHCDLSRASHQAVLHELQQFEERVRGTRPGPASPGDRKRMVSIEVPVFKGGWLIPCIESVLLQSSDQWSLSLLWDGGDELSRQILERVASLQDPRISVHFERNRGIAGARRVLSSRSQGHHILPLDDDDLLDPRAVERLLAEALAKPWSGIIRAQRRFVDEQGHQLDTAQWFPFEPRHYSRGMTTDLHNHCQPYLIRRSAYDLTTGWEGFEDFQYAGEDCDMFLKIEEVGSIELVDETLYYYRINPQRTSLELTKEAAFEMWRRLADLSIARIGLPIKRTNQSVPFEYERLKQEPLNNKLVAFVIAQAEGDGQLWKHTVQSLVDAGIDPDSVDVTRGRSPSASWNHGALHSTKPLVCFLTGGTSIESIETVDKVISAMEESQIDIVAPIGADAPGQAASGFAPWGAAACMVVRREVFRAVGGFDDTYSDPRASEIDFCFKAAQRDFKIADGPSIAVRDPSNIRSAINRESQQQLRERWRDWLGPHSFAEGA